MYSIEHAAAPLVWNYWSHTRGNVTQKTVIPNRTSSSGRPVVRLLRNCYTSRSVVWSSVTALKSASPPSVATKMSKTVGRVRTVEVLVSESYFWKRFSLKRRIQRFQDGRGMWNETVEEVYHSQESSQLLCGVGWREISDGRNFDR